MKSMFSYLNSKFELWIVHRIKAKYECTDLNNASMITDGCIAIIEGLSNGQTD